jgi:hypothetical protein
MTTKPLPLSAIAFLFILISCRKNDIPQDGNEKLTKLEIYDPIGQRTFTTNYTYDNTGKLTEVYSFTSGSSYTEKQSLTYDASGKITSNTRSNNVDGDIFRYDFQVDGNGRIIKALATSFSPGLLMDSHIYAYDNKGNLISDSTFPQPGSVYMQNGSKGVYVHFEYDNNNNVVAYQQYVKEDDTAVYTQGRWTFDYDNKRSPYSKVGQTLYTCLSGGVDYFYLSRHNPTRASLDNTVITPGGNFVYQYYDNALLKTSRLNVSNTLMTTFYYTQ